MDRDTTPQLPRLRVTRDEASRAPVLPGHLSALVAQYGSVELRWYSPPGHDDQTPHDRDEMYLIVTGTAVFMRAEESAPFADDHELSLAAEDRVTVQPGDVLFVPAGTVHRFEAISSDFASWMIFYGPEGGERP